MEGYLSEGYYVLEGVVSEMVIIKASEGAYLVRGLLFEVRDKECPYFL